MSKAAIAALLGVLGSLVIFGIQELGRQLDLRLKNRDVLTAVVWERVEQPSALEDLAGEPSAKWTSAGFEAVSFRQAGGTVRLSVGGGVLRVIAVQDIERFGLTDDFHLLSDSYKPGRSYEIELGGHRSEAVSGKHRAETRLISQAREVILCNQARVMPLLLQGYTNVTILHPESLGMLEKAHHIVKAVSTTERSAISIQSNLEILEELKTISAIQKQALVSVTVMCALILGLVMGSLAWMEYREEQYVLALIRSFGVGGGLLFFHALVENSLIAVLGVGMGILAVVQGMGHVDLSAYGGSWLGSAEVHMSKELWLLVFGAAVGGVLSAVPVAVGLRKPIGLVLK